jgi:hypothetical protein
MQPDFAAELALAEQPATLVDQVGVKLMGGTAGGRLAHRDRQRGRPSRSHAHGHQCSNQVAIDKARRNRVNAAVFLALVSPEFQVQK